MNTVFFSIRLAFAFSFTGSSWIFPCILAWQNGAAGHSSHLGSQFGTHTIAPSSMSPWLKSPAQSFGIIFLSFSSICFLVLCFIMSLSSAVILVITRRTLPSTAGYGSPKENELIAPDG